MTEPRGDGPRGPEDDDLAAGGLGDLDLALDELAAGRDVPTERVGGETAALATLATELRAAVPPPPAGAAERGRAAFLAPAASGRAALVATAAGRRARGRSLPLRMAAVAAALVVLVALPATARQARPGTTLWPVRVPWVGERPQAPFAVPVPDTTAPADEPATRPADQPGPPAAADQSLADLRRNRSDNDQPGRRADDRDRDDDSSGPGSGGDDSGGGGSSGPG